MSEEAYLPPGDSDPGHYLPDEVWEKVVDDAERRKFSLSPLKLTLTIPARSHGGAMKGDPTLLVVHSAECPIKAGYARSLATNWFGFAGTAKTSAHEIIDPEDAVVMVPDDTIAYHCGNGNARSLGFEQGGYAKYTRAEWTTPEGLQQMDLLATRLAVKCLKYGIPARWATAAQIKASATGSPGGICTHKEVAAVLGGSVHTDPMPNYPTDLLLAKVQEKLAPAPTVPTPDEENDMKVILRKSTGVTYSIAPGFIYAHADAQEQRVAKYLDAAGTIYQLSEEDFYRTLKIFGFSTVAGTYGDWKGMTSRLPVPSSSLKA